MTAFFIDGKIITDKKQILDMWLTILRYWVLLQPVNDMVTIFFTGIAKSVKDTVTSCIEDLSGVLNEPLQYDEVECVCSQLKPGITGVSIDYEHIRFAGQICGFFCINRPISSCINLT